MDKKYMLRSLIILALSAVMLAPSLLCQGATGVPVNIRQDVTMWAFGPPGGVPPNSSYSDSTIVWAVDQQNLSPTEGGTYSWYINGTQNISFSPTEFQGTLTTNSSYVAVYALGDPSTSSIATAIGYDWAPASVCDSPQGASMYTYVDSPYTISIDSSDFWGSLDASCSAGDPSYTNGFYDRHHVTVRSRMSGQALPYQFQVQELLFNDAPAVTNNWGNPQPATFTTGGQGSTSPAEFIDLYCAGDSAARNPHTTLGPSNPHTLVVTGEHVYCAGFSFTASYGDSTCVNGLSVSHTVDQLYTDEGIPTTLVTPY